jgi:hypothetical protein
MSLPITNATRLGVRYMQYQNAHNREQHADGYFKRVKQFHILWSLNEIACGPLFGFD